MKKLIALLLAIVCVLGLCAGCGGKGGNGGAGGNGGNGGNGGSNAGADVDPADVTLTIGLPMDANVQDLENNALTKYLQERTGYTLKFQIYPDGSQIGTNITTAALAGEKLPDILFGVPLSGDAVRNFGEQEYIIDLQDYFADKEGASKVFWDRMAENLSADEQSDVIRKMTDIETGAIYAVPSMEISPIDVIDYQVWINKVWLDKLNLKMPTNTDELYEVLVAFKENDCNGDGNPKDELPLNGAQSGTLGSDVVNWLVNQFMYFNEKRNFVVEGDKVVPGYTTDSYRKALIYINKLYKEGLLPETAFTNNNNNLKLVTTPQDGKAKCGIFVGHLTLHSIPNAMVLEEYVPLPPLENQTSVYNSNNFSLNCMITSDCEYPDQAFNLLMVMREEESSLRVRYGEFGVNWEYAQEGDVSDMGYPAKIRILKDPFGTPNTCQWVSAAGSFTVHAEGESAYFTEGTTPWEKLRSKMHAESAANYAAAAEKNNPDVICPSLSFTDDEKAEIEYVAREVGEIITAYTNDFMKNKKNPGDDAMWNKFKNDLKAADVDLWIALHQKAYDRQK